MKLIHQGSVKDIYELEGSDEIEFSFSDRISVFDKPIPTEIPHKGETLCKTTVHWFKMAESLGIKTHFIEVTSKNSIRVKKVDIIHDYDRLNEKATSYLVPLELITRYYLAGSLYERVSKGEVLPEELGFGPNYTPEYGEELPKPHFETTTKLERVDRRVSQEEALRISGLREEELAEIRRIIGRIDGRINEEVKSRGLIHVDGKKEFGFDSQRSLMLIDVFGTADEDRFWDMEEYKRGRQIELSKEFVRQHYKRTGYKDALYEAREKGQPEPDIPPLPDDVVEAAGKIYIDLYQRITGEKFY